MAVWVDGRTEGQMVEGEYIPPLAATHEHKKTGSLPSASRTSAQWCTKSDRPMPQTQDKTSGSVYIANSWNKCVGIKEDKLTG